MLVFCDIHSWAAASIAARPDPRWLISVSPLLAGKVQSGAGKDSAGSLDLEEAPKADAGHLPPSTPKRSSGHSAGLRLLLGGVKPRQLSSVPPAEPE